MKPKGVTTQMKALDEYIVMVLFVLLLKRVHVLGIFERVGSQRKTDLYSLKYHIILVSGNHCKILTTLGC